MSNLSSDQLDEIAKLLSKTEEPDVVDRLNDWEQNFVISAAEQFSNTNWLSDKQINKLKKIVEGDDGSGGSHVRSISRPAKLSYGSSEAAGSNSGGFSGFTRSSSKDQSDDNN